MSEESPAKSGWRVSARLWLARNGLIVDRPGLPGVVHQTWGWYDGLSNGIAALVTIAAMLFLLSTSAYLFAATRIVSTARANPLRSAGRPSPPLTDLIGLGGDPFDHVAPML